MKQILFLLLCCLPLVNGYAQDDSKYLAGAVPMVDGRVTFTATISAPSLSKQQIYQVMLDWANNYFKPTEATNGKLNPRVLLSNEEEGSIVANGEEYMIFNSSFLSLDRTRIYYHFFINCQDGKSILTMTRIHYLYDEGREGGVKYTAETWIDDKSALNKAKTKLNPLCGKFRRKTVDLKDNIFKSAENAVGQYLIASDQQRVPQPQVVLEPTVPVTTITPVTQEKAQVVQQPEPFQQQAVIEKETITPVASVSETKKEMSHRKLIDMASGMTLSANGEEIKVGKEAWGGFGEMLGKKVAFIVLDTQKAMANMLLTSNEAFEISFYPVNSNIPNLTVKCKKLMQQSVQGEEAVKMNKGNQSGKTYNMFVGEVIE